MTTLDSRGFARELGRDGGAINVNDLSPDMEKALADAGVRLSELRKVAGADGQIRGDQEWGRLFKLVDGFDSDGNAGTFLARDARGTETKAGALFDELKKVVEKQVGKARDEIAQLGVSLWQVGTGAIPANRLVLSGHQSAGTLWGGDSSSPSENEIALDTVGDLAAIFPQGANKIEHLALSACNCGGQEDIDKYRTWFPNLDSVWAYDGFSPKAEGGAPKQLATWESLTDGDDPSRVDPKFDSVSTWNRRDGFRVHP